jgi:hypothetical protein
MIVGHHLINAQVQAFLRDKEKLLNFRGYVSDGHSKGGIAAIALIHNAEIEADDVAVNQDPIAGYPVNNFLIDGRAQ